MDRYTTERQHEDDLEVMFGNCIFCFAAGVMGSPTTCCHQGRNGKYKEIKEKETGNICDARQMAINYGQAVYIPDVLTKELLASWKCEVHSISSKELMERLPSDPRQFTEAQEEIAKGLLGELAFEAWKQATNRLAIQRGIQQWCEDISEIPNSNEEYNEDRRDGRK